MICRLCLKDIPKESSIKLYENLDTSSDSLEMVKLIEKYLEIEIKQNDIVSTIICQDCYDHLEEFHRFSQQVAEKQLTLRNEFMDVNLKKEFNFDDDGDAWDNDDQEDKIEMDPKETTQMTINCPISMFKDESENDDDDDNDEKEMPTEDLMDTVIGNVEKDIIAPDSVAVNEEEDDDFLPDQISSEDDDVPLIKLKSTKKTKNAKTKRKRTPAKTREIKEKKPAKKKLSAQEEVAMSMDLVCDICQTRVETWKELREHFLLAHTKTPYIKCCDITYRKPRELIEHLEWHKNPDMFKCQICDKNMSSARNLTIHITSEHPDEADSVEFYECEHCSKRIRNYNLFKKHLRSHNKDKEVECHICNKRCATIYRLRNHIASVHNNIYHHICDICGKKFKSKTSFQKHYDEHQGIVEPPAQCTICGAWLKNQHSLRVHHQTHEDTQFACDICGKFFKTKKNLSRHKGYWHRRERNLSCSYCDKVFREKRNLDEHMAMHTDTNLYTCPHCGKESRSKSNMYVHIKRQHPDEWWKSKQERYKLKPEDGGEAQVQEDEIKEKSSEVAIEGTAVTSSTLTQECINAE
ncbi:transcription factor grauzone-like isoform X1 [Lucilia cuprina]|uniref:transcription factor grauzone-like isoform X1 n=1 Tax=Lucilia cuprina TaxID=7375 RepID=UPI001F054327|nr:transcription factor grauzone-like isoform X1 [Lucilia cuprina]